MSVSIHEQSEQMKAAAAEHLPAEVVEVFDRSIQNLLDEAYLRTLCRWATSWHRSL